ncbi:MAG: hypothetical protein KKB09_07210 [Nanoarchaeota archaeon]|nr:hypothetical protein [Nanoarchaeota archaeon]
MLSDNKINDLETLYITPPISNAELSGFVERRVVKIEERILNFIDKRLKAENNIVKTKISIREFRGICGSFFFGNEYKIVLKLLKQRGFLEYNSQNITILRAKNKEASL